MFNWIFFRFFFIEKRIVLFLQQLFCFNCFCIELSYLCIVKSPVARHGTSPRTASSGTGIFIKSGKLTDVKIIELKQKSQSMFRISENHPFRQYCRLLVTECDSVKKCVSGESVKIILILDLFQSLLCNGCCRFI